MLNPTPVIIPDATPPGGTGCATQLWIASAVPSGDSVIQSQFHLGDLLLVTIATGGLPALYKCVTAPSSTNKDGLWQPCAIGARGPYTTAVAYTATAMEGVIILTGNAAVTLPTPSAANAGIPLTVKRVGAANGSVAGAIDAGATSAAFGADYSAITVINNGTAWYALSTYGTVNIT